MTKSNSLTQQSKALEKRLLAIPEDVQIGVQPALIKGAEEIAGAMALLVPVEDGDLKSSITVTPPNQTTPAYAEGGGKRTAASNQALVTAGNEKVRHGHLQEFGTVAHEAQPFMRPALRIMNARVMRRIQRAIGQSIKKASEE